MWAIKIFKTQDVNFVCMQFMQAVKIALKIDRRGEFIIYNFTVAYKT